MKETIIYIRTSTDEQNPENQLADCLTINKFGDYNLIEDRQSAWKENSEREGFNNLKKEITKGNVKNLIVWDLDRIYRNRKHLIEFFKLCEVYKCKVWSFRQEWLIKISEMPSPWNEIITELMIQIMGWLAQDESDKKSKRVRNAIRIVDGESFSYKGNRWGRTPYSKEIIAKVLELRMNGLSIRQIAKQVTMTDKNNNQKPISLGGVHKIINLHPREDE